MQAVAAYQSHTGRKVDACGRVGGRRLGFATGAQLDVRYSRFFVWIDQPRCASIELICYVEQMLGELVRRHPRQQRTSDMQMHLGSLLRRYQRIRRLLYSVVKKFVGIVVAEHEAGV